MAHAVPLGLSHIGLSKELYVTVAVPLGFEMQGQSTKTILRYGTTVPLGFSKKCRKRFDKRSLCNSRCAIGIWDVENFKKAIWHKFLKSTNISLCAMSRLDLVTFRFSVGRRCAIVGKGYHDARNQKLHCWWEAFLRYTELLIRRLLMSVPVGDTTKQDHL